MLKLAAKTAVLAALAAAFAAPPASAVTAKEKKATCEFGAESQKLSGAARKSFMTKCMANEDRAAKKQKPKAQPAAQ
ncbi:MAG: PsiF family protein [Variibacter sp.]